MKISAMRNIATPTDAPTIVPKSFGDDELVESEGGSKAPEVGGEGARGGDGMPPGGV